MHFNKLWWIGITLLFISISFNLSAQQKNLKIISYNILEGMKLDTTSNKDYFVSWVKSQNPDILALQELNSFTQKQLEELARKFNHPYAVLLKEKGYPVGLTSKFPIINVEKVLDNMLHGFIKAEILDYSIYVIHLSPHKYQKRREETDLILQMSQSKPNHQKKTIIMGDFNSISESDAEAYKDGKLWERFNFNDNKYPTHANLCNGQLDYEVHRKIVNAGYVDAFKLLNKPYDYSAPTLLTSNGGETPSYRIDFIYVSKSLKHRIKRAAIVKDDFTNYYSDHYPVVIEIMK